MKPVGVKSTKYIDFGKNNNKEDPKLKVGDYVRLSKYWSEYQNIKCYVPNWSEDVLWLKKLKMLFHGHRLLEIVTVGKLLEYFTKKNCKRQTKYNLEQKK